MILSREAVRRQMEDAFHACDVLGGEDGESLHLSLVALNLSLAPLLGGDLAVIDIPAPVLARRPEAEF